jgi:hypothetical protein
MLASPKTKEKASETPKRSDDTLRKLPNLTGIPDVTKQRFENLSGLSFDDVRVHYNSDKPAQLQALAYTRGNHVYVGPGQEKHLGHELGHVVQQKQGMVKPNTYLNGLALNTEPQMERAADLALRIDVPRQSGGTVHDVVQRWSVPMHSSIINYAFWDLTDTERERLEKQMGNKAPVPTGVAGAAGATTEASTRVAAPTMATATPPPAAAAFAGVTASTRTTTVPPTEDAPTPMTAPRATTEDAPMMTAEEAVSTGRDEPMTAEEAVSTGRDEPMTEEEAVRPLAAASPASGPTRVEAKSYIDTVSHVETPPELYSTAAITEEFGVLASKEISTKQNETLRNIRKGSAWNDLTSGATAFEKGHEKREGVRLFFRLLLRLKKIYDSHEGAMQFLHAQADVTETPQQTKKKMLAWAQTCYQICLATDDELLGDSTASGTKPMTLGEAIDLAGVRADEDAKNPRTFTGSLKKFLDKPLAKFFNVKIKKSKYNKENVGRIRMRALGSMLHMVQDSFNQAHGQRTAGKRIIQTRYSHFSAGKIKNFTAYTAQNADKHKTYDLPSDVGSSYPTFKLAQDYQNEYGNLAKTEGYYDAVHATKTIMQFVGARTAWKDEPREFFEELFTLADAVEDYKPEDAALSSPDSSSSSSSSSTLSSPDSSSSSSSSSTSSSPDSSSPDSTADAANQKPHPVTATSVHEDPHPEIAKSRHEKLTELHALANKVAAKTKDKLEKQSSKLRQRLVPESGRTLRKKSFEDMAKSHFDKMPDVVSKAKSYDAAIENEFKRVNKTEETRIETINARLRVLEREAYALDDLQESLSSVPPGEKLDKFIDEIKKENEDLLIDVHSLQEEIRELLIFFIPPQTTAGISSTSFSSTSFSSGSSSTFDSRQALGKVLFSSPFL